MSRKNQQRLLEQAIHLVETAEEQRNQIIERHGATRFMRFLRSSNNRLWRRSHQSAKLIETGRVSDA